MVERMASTSLYERAEHATRHNPCHARVSHLFRFGHAGFLLLQVVISDYLLQGLTNISSSNTIN